MSPPAPGSVLILDGGLGTSLEDGYGAIFDDSTPLWSSHFIVSDPDTLHACQRDFAEAGVDVLLTATYQVSVEGFARTKVPEFPNGIPRYTIRRYLANAVDIADRAKVRSSTSLALSLGPYGACMVPGQEYSGEYDDEHNTEDALYQWHLERLELFTGVQGLMDRIRYVAFETIPRLDEIRAIRRAYQDADIGKDFWISCVFPGADNSLPDGTAVDHTVEGMLGPLSGGAKPWGIGINCTKIHRLSNLINSYEDSVKTMIDNSGLDTAPCLLVYPDGTKGEVYNTTTKKWEKQDGEPITDQEESWAKEVARIVRTSQDGGVFTSFVVGGCCKASPADIAELRQEFPDPACA